MKVLLDECVDRRLAAHITGHEVDSVQDVGWRSIKNGELLRLAEGRYGSFVTVDRNLAFQQRLHVSTSPLSCCGQEATM